MVQAGPSGSTNGVSAVRLSIRYNAPSSTWRLHNVQQHAAPCHAARCTIPHLSQVHVGDVGDCEALGLWGREIQ